MKDYVLSDPGWFLLFTIIPVLCFLYQRFLGHRQSVLIVTAIPGLSGDKTAGLLSPPALIFSLRIFAMLFIIMGLINLQSVKSVKYYKMAREADIIFAIDISRSMEAEDIKPNRLEALKDVLNGFIAARVNDRLGIVLYAGESIYWCPLTNSYSFITTRLREMDDKALKDGTAIGLGIISAVNALHQSKSKNKIIILLTDGENNTGFVDPLTAARIAKNFNIKVYTIGMGTNGFASISVKDLNGNTVKESIPVSIDESMLKQIAALTGGSYFRATDKKVLQNIYNAIDKMEKTKTVRVTEVKYKPEYRFFAGSAMFFLMLELILRFTLLRTWPE